tara:strand:- start:323 stop:1210 length:888 start_codon:yes stop_codon:yes gene_type:complete
MKKNKGHMGSTIKFKSKEDRNLFMNDFNSDSEILKIFNSWNYKGTYDTKFIDFESVIISELISKKIITEKNFIKYDYSLDDLHLCLHDNIKSLDQSEQNQISISFYEASKKIQDMYVKFISNIISPIFSGRIHYQVVPTFRFHFPNQKGYEWKDRYHTDIMLGHPPYEFNVWLPFTKVFESNSMRLTPLNDSVEIYKMCNNNFEILAEKCQYDNDFISHLSSKSSPLDMKYGEFIIFDPKCLHCTQHNITNKTRISMDIRIMLENNFDKYSREYKTTGRKKMLFKPGYYFSKEAL